MLKMTIQETEHARQRRAERAIDKKDLELAVKNGRELPCRFGRKYHYKGITYIVSWDGIREITCYASSFKMKRVYISAELLQQYARSFLLEVEHGNSCGYVW
mmetsp:Transcript_14738/g.27718  ORF Transcript_14738/g.27718 Transcript_14738/m.27718 type:complete len:102 (+) Transcript_14738:375-680(+)